MNGIQAGFHVMPLQNSSRTPQASSLSYSGPTFKKQMTDGFLRELSQKYRVSVSAEAIPTREKEVKSRIYGGRLSTITIAPNILEDMQLDSGVRNRVESRIEQYFLDQRQLELQLNATGWEATASGIIIHEDGSWTHWGGCAPSPEEQAKIDRDNEENQKRKQAERQQNEQVWVLSSRTVTSRNQPNLGEVGQPPFLISAIPQLGGNG